MMPVSLFTSITETSDVLLFFRSVSSAFKSITPSVVAGIFVVGIPASRIEGCSMLEARIFSFGYVSAKCIKTVLLLSVAPLLKMICVLGRFTSFAIVSRAASTILRPLRPN